ncbi:MAG: septal ring lytic transglycosylase RlpA family protein [Treponema sp.]|nr:septal ring lytic transglycosylase RlpA family protein [Treponema sp.]
MKKLYIIVIILLISVVIPFQLAAQSMDVFRQDGIASWYGREFEGRPTASGEIFDSSQFTAAHPSLPFGTMLTVTNQHNNKSVTVRVNDRGPFVPARIIDVSRAAAEQLDMIVTGTAPVTVTSIERIVTSTPAVSTPVIGSQILSDEVQSIPTVPNTVTNNTIPIINEQNVISVTSASPVFVSQPVMLQPIQPVIQFRLMPDITIIPNRNYRFQVGAYRVARNAVESFDKLKATGLNPAYERYTNGDNIEFYRVVIAGVPGIDVQATIEKMTSAGFREAIIREEN